MYILTCWKKCSNQFFLPICVVVVVWIPLLRLLYSLFSLPDDPDVVVRVGVGVDGRGDAGPVGGVEAQEGVERRESLQGGRGKVFVADQTESENYYFTFGWKSLSFC